MTSTSTKAATIWVVFILLSLYFECMNFEWGTCTHICYQQHNILDGSNDVMLYTYLVGIITIHVLVFLTSCSMCRRIRIALTRM